ncbi:alanine--tRNA ligase, partial [Mycoplasmopsis synoviae]
RQYLIMDIDQAKVINAIMTLEETEYMDSSKLRIVNFNVITADLCGGTHLENTKLLRNFKITTIKKKSEEVYRIKDISSKETIKKYLKNQKQELMQELL